MESATNLRVQWLCAWAGFVFIGLYIYCWAYLGHTQPPLSPTLSAGEVAAFYAAHHEDILLGMTLAAVIGGLWVPWTAQLTLVLRRIEGPWPVLTVTQAIGGVLTTWALVFCAAMWAAAAFRPDADPNVVRALSDIAYLSFNLTYVVTVVQAVPAGIIGLSDKSPNPVFPRWSCWVAILAGISFFTVSAMSFVKTGPMALDGAFVGWIPGTMYFVWTGVTTYALVRDAGRRMRAARAG